MRDQIDLQEAFPEMRPIERAPGLGTINGIGLTLYGRRASHRETGTWIATRCFVVLFVPVVAIDAWRVGRARGGMVALGKERLGPLARLWNLTLLVVVLAAVGNGAWQHHVSSPEYRDGRRLAEARAALDQGEHDRALKAAIVVATGGTAHAAPARELVAGIAAGLDARPAQEAVAVLTRLEDVGERVYPRAALDRDLEAAFERYREDQPIQAMAVLDLVAARQPQRDLAAEREALLRRLVERRPDELEWAQRLALIHEERGELAACEALLAPHAERLGDGEGARILGGILAGRGEHRAAHPLLLAYCSSRLGRLKLAEAAYTKAQERAYDDAIRQLQQGRAGDAWYRRYEQADEAAQQQLITAWVGERVQRDPELERAAQRLREVGAIVPVALELGIVTLHRAQDQTDPDERQRDLAAAEETFLAVRGLAGESDEFHLFYGQVCYWLGKREAGKAEFDHLLAAHQRSPQMLLMVAGSMRDVGILAEARRLMEEAYRGAADDEQRHAAAGLRASTPEDQADELRWLERCDQSLPQIRCQLASARGGAALEAGRLAEAEDHLRQALAQWDQIAPTSAGYNNSALVANQLYACTGDLAMLEDTVRRLEAGLALAPGDTILQYHLALRLEERGLARVAGTRIDHRSVPLSDHWPLVSFCYRDEAERQALIDELVADPDWSRAMALYDRLTVLFAQNPSVHQRVVRHHALVRDEAALERIAARLAEQRFDHPDDVAAVRARYAGAQDQEVLTGIGLQLARIAAGAEAADPTVAGVVAAIRADAALIAAAHGGDFDPDAAVALAEAAVEAHASPGAHASLIAALAARALRRQAERDRRVADLQQRCGRAFGVLDLLAWGGRNGLDLSADPDCHRIAQEVIELQRRLPRQVDVQHWALLAAMGHPDAERVAATVRDDRLEARREELLALLDPTDCSLALHRAWRAELAGGDPEVVLAGYREHDLPLPAW